MRKSPWQIDDDEVFQLRRHGGTRFTAFVDALIRAEAQRAGAPLGVVQTNIRATIPDGGVDTDVKEPIGEHVDFATPTVWQYKAARFTRVTAAELRKEVAKPFATQRIREGASYRACVCDDITAEMREDRERALREAVQQANPAAPEPRLLAASDLAEWANRFPSIVARFFRPYLAGGVLSYTTWGDQMRADLPAFVPPDSWSEIQDAVAGHLDFESQAQGVYALTGGLGVGKTRLVHEAVVGSSDLIIYVPDERTALGVASALLNDERLTAVLVVDDCTTATWRKLDGLIRAPRRVRCVAILDSVEDVPPSVPRVARLAEAESVAVLDGNFPELASTTRRGVARLCEGVLTLAANLCRGHEHESTTSVEGTADAVDRMLAGVLRSDPERRVVEGLSLLGRVGFHADVSGELRALGDVMQMNPPEIVHVARRVSQSIGLVHVGRRYLAVRPRLFGRALLRSAWARWAEPDPGAFLDGFPPVLLHRLLEQLAQHATDDIRDSVAMWAQAWLSGLTSAALTNPDTRSALLPLVKIHPQRHLPVLRRLLDEASLDERRGALVRTGRGYPLVPILEELMAFPHLYSDAEASMYCLALAAPGQRGAGSAWSRWSSSFRLFLSDTATPFEERMARLRERVVAASSMEEGELIAQALGRAVEGRAFRMLGAPLVSGRLRPREWRPQTREELTACLRDALAVLRQMLVRPDLRRPALDVLKRRGRELLAAGLLSDVTDCVAGVPLGREDRAALECSATEFLDYDCAPDTKGTRRPSDDYIAEVRNWDSELRGDSLEDRIESALSARTLKSYLDDKETFLAEIRDLATELCADESAMIDALPWLTTRQFGGRGLVELGEYVGTFDPTGQLLDAVLDAAMTGTSPLFSRGYVIGFCSGDQARKDKLESALDAREGINPSVVLDMTVMVLGGQRTTARATRLVAAGSLPPRAMGEVWRSNHGARSLVEMVNVLLHVPADNAQDAACVAIDLLGHPVTRKEDETYRADPAVRDVCWDALRASMPDAGQASYWWGQLLETLGPYDEDQAIAIACAGVVSSDFSIQDEATRCLIELAADHAPIILRSLETVLRDPDALQMFGVGRRHHLIASLPVNLLSDWLQRQPIDTVCAVANHLALPFVNGDGEPVVPELTSFVLATYENDDAVFQAFVHGAHDTQIYTGDIAAQKLAEAKTAQAFFNHPLRRVREWARSEHDAGKAEARFWHERHEEDFDG